MCQARLPDWRPVVRPGEIGRWQWHWLLVLEGDLPVGNGALEKKIKKKNKDFDCEKKRSGTCLQLCDAPGRDSPDRCDRCIELQQYRPNLQLPCRPSSLVGQEEGAYSLDGFNNAGSLIHYTQDTYYLEILWTVTKVATLTLLRTGRQLAPGLHIESCSRQRSDTLSDSVP